MRLKNAKGMFGLMALLLSAACMQEGEEQQQQPAPSATQTAWEAAASDQSRQEFGVTGHRILLDRSTKSGVVTYLDERGQGIGEFRFSQEGEDKASVSLILRGKEIYNLAGGKKSFFGKAQDALTADENALLQKIQSYLVTDTVAKLADGSGVGGAGFGSVGSCQTPCWLCGLSVAATPGFPFDELAFCVACLICVGA